MSALSACQTAMVRLVGRKSSSIFSSQNGIELEIADLATEVAVDIMKSHDWRALTKIHTLTGDGALTSFALPVDYDRIVLAQDVDDGNNWLWGYTPVGSLSDWIRITSSGFTAITPGWWILLDGKMQFSPAPSSGSPAVFPYISNYIGRAADNTPITALTQDTDEFLLGDRLLTLGIIWKWRAQKRLEYAEDMSNYEIALSQAQARDKGSQAIRKGGAGRMAGTQFAWPWHLG